MFIFLKPLYPCQLQEIEWILVLCKYLLEKFHNTKQTFFQNNIRYIAV